MRIVRRLLRLLTYAVLVVLAFAVGAAAVYTLTARGRDNLAALISDMASAPDRKVKITGIDGIWSGNFTMDQLVLEDAEGPWLAARGLKIDWSPMALLSRTFKAELVEAERVEIARVPKPGEPKPASEGSNSLPIDIDVQALNLPDIALGEAVTGGQVASVAAKGNAVIKASPLAIQSDLTVERTDGVAGQVVASLQFAPDENKLAVDLKASEPSGGILANLLQLPDKPAVDIIVTGAGPLADWKGTGTFSVDGALVTTVSATHRETGTGSFVEAKGDGEFMRFLPERFRSLLAGKADFDIAGTLAKDGGIDIDRGSIESGALTASAVGSYDPDGATDLAIELTAKNNGIPLAFGTDESPIDIVVGSASVRALGDGLEPGLDISAKLPSVSTNDVKLADLALMLHSDAFNVKERSGPVIGSAAAKSLTIDNPTIAPLVAGEIGASLEGILAADKLTVSKGVLRSDAIDGGFAGDVSLADGSITLKLNADVVSAALPPAARPALGEKVAITAELERDHSGNTSAKSLSVKSGGLTADGSAELREGTVNAELNGSLADIAPLAPGASGAVSLAATATGSLMTPDVDLTVTSDRVAVGERAIDDLELKVAGRADLANPQMSLALTGAFQGEQLQGKAVASTADGKRELSDIDFAVGPNRVAGTLSLDEQNLPIGTLQIDFPELARLAALAGQTVEGAAAGSLEFSKAGDIPQVKAVLNAESIKRDQLTVGPLAVDALIADYMKQPSVSGTVAATLADLLPGQPPLTANLSVSGSAADFNALGKIAMEGNDIVSDLSVNYKPAETGSAITVTGKGALARFLPERLRQLALGTTEFDISALLAKAGPVQIEKADFTSGPLAVSATGTVDPNGPIDVALRVDGGTNGVALAFGTEESPIDITIGNATIRAGGTREVPSLDISASLPSVSTSDVELAQVGVTLHSDAFNIASRSGPVKGGITASKLTIDNPTIAPLVAGALLAEIDGTLTTEALAVERGVLRSDAIDGGFGGTVSLANGVITLKLNAEVLSSALPAAARPLLGDKLALSTNLSRDSEGNVSANALALQSGGLKGDGVIKLAGGQIDADIKGALADVSPLSAQAKGSIAFAATAKGALSAPDVTLSVTSDKMTVAARDIENLQLNASGRADIAKPEASVTIKGTVGGEILDGKAVLNTADGQRAVRDLNLSLGKNRIVGALSLDPNFVPEGTIDFDLPDLGPLAALALETVEGSAKGNAVFTKTGDAAQAKIKLNSSGITRGDISVKSVSVDALLADYMRAPGISGKVQAAEVNAGGTAVRKIGLDLSMDNGWTRFSGGAEVNAIPLNAAGRVKSAAGTTTVELASAQATVQGIKAALARASTVRIVNGETTLDKFALNVGGGSVSVSGTAGKTLNLDATLAKMPASVVNNFVPALNAAGTISGNAKVTGAAADPSVSYTMNWAGAETAQTRSAGAGAFAINSTGTFAAKRLNFDVKAGNGSGLTVKGGGTVAMATPPQLNLKFDGAVPFGFLARQLAAQGMALTGEANVNVTVTGAATAPVIGGTIRTAGARLVDARSGIAVNDIAADVVLGSGRATINRVTGKLSSGGELSAAGFVGMASPFPADIAIKLTDARYTDGQVVTTTLSGDLALKGGLVASPVLSGTINLARTVISIPERLPGSLRALDVQHKNAPAAVRKQDQELRPQTPASGSGGGGLALDLTINAPQRIFIQGRGLDAELGGSLRLTGRASAPQAVGQFEMHRGRLVLLGRRLTFTRGILGFSGSLIPYLDMAAEFRASDATVTVIVNGPANNPKFSFTSVPSLPEDEVLARLIFGRAMSNLSPLQIAQLADAASQLAGGGGTTSLLNSLRDKLGVDDLDIKTDDEGGTAVSIGKYLNDRTYLTIEKGDKAGAGKAAIDFDVGRGVKLRGEARDDGEAKGGIFYEKEY